MHLFPVVLLGALLHSRVAMCCNVALCRLLLLLQWQHHQ